MLRGRTLHTATLQQESGMVFQNAYLGHRGYKPPSWWHVLLMLPLQAVSCTHTSVQSWMVAKMSQCSWMQNWSCSQISSDSAACDWQLPFKALPVELSIGFIKALVSSETFQSTQTVTFGSNTFPKLVSRSLSITWLLRWRASKNSTSFDLSLFRGPLSKTSHQVQGAASVTNA